MTGRPDSENPALPVPSPIPTPSPLPTPTPTPCAPCADDDDEPELRQLEAAYLRGELTVAALELGPLPAGATPVMRAIERHMALRFGMRLSVGDDRPMPYALSEAVNAGLAPSTKAASRAIGRLVRAGVVREAGEMDPTIWPRGTKLYVPPVAVLQAAAVAVEAERVRRVPAEPRGEAGHQVGVGAADVDVPGGGLLAAGGDADGGVGAGAHGAGSPSVGPPDSVVPGDPQEGWRTDERGRRHAPWMRPEMVAMIDEFRSGAS